MSLTLAEQLRSSIITLNLAQASFGIYWKIYGVGRDTAVLNEFPGLFIVAGEAGLRNALVNLSTFFDKRRDTITLGSMVALLSAADRARIEPKIAAATAKAASVLAVRHGALAHRNRMKSRREIFEDAKVTADDVRALMADLKEILTDIAKAANLPEPTCNTAAVEDFDRLCEFIRRHDPGIADTTSD